MTTAPATGSRLARLDVANGWTPAAKPGKATTTITTPDNASPDTQTDTKNDKQVKFAAGEWVLAAFAFLMAVGVSTIGLISSYHAVEHKAALPVSEKGWGWVPSQAWMLPIGIDLSILAFSLINLLLIRADRPAAWVKWVPRLGAAGTIYLNWQSSTSLPAQIGHAVLAGLWVVFSEIGAHLYATHIGEARGRIQMDRIRLSRWIHQPISTLRIAHHMKSYEITSYRVALKRDQDWGVYKTMLREEYGMWWKFKAPSTKLTPIQLASNGLTVDEALEVPDLQVEKARLRTQAADLRKAEADLQRIKAESKLNAAKLAAKTEEVEAEGALKVATARAETAASIEVQKAEADLQVHQAEAQSSIRLMTSEADSKIQAITAQEQRRASEIAREQQKDQLNWDLEKTRLELEKQAESSALALESQMKENAETARARQAAQEAERAAAQAEKDAADLRKQAAEADRKKDEADLSAAEARLKAAEAEEAREAAERGAQRNRQAAADARLKAAETEKAAAEAEAEARVSPVERDARKVADMIRTNDKVTLEQIAAELGVSVATAHSRKKRAEQLLTSV